MKKQAVYFVSLGCPKNRVDTEVMLGLSDRAGFTIARAPEDADVIVVNTCGFIGEAKEESVDTILEMARYKSDGSCQAARRHRLPDAALRRRPGARPARGRSLPRLGRRRQDRRRAARRDAARRRRRWTRPISTTTSRRACSRCRPTPPTSRSPRAAIAPARSASSRSCAAGSARARAESVEREVRDLVARGAVEINLVAQDLTTYGKDLDGELQLASLVRRLAHVDGLRWLRLHYAYPTATTDALLDAIAEEPRVAKYIDMPLQHIDDDDARSTCAAATSARPRARWSRRSARASPASRCAPRSSSAIPGETDAAFDNLVDFVREAEFDRVGVFTYSNEDGTHARQARRRARARCRPRRWSAAAASSCACSARSRARR